MFSDGRQCTMARSDIHPSLCIYHSDREEQLFGDPGGSFVTRKLDLPELYSACGDLTTAAGVNRALGQVFRLLAQRRISRQEAATFAKLGHLLLRTISDMRSSRESPAANVYLPAAEVYQQDELPPCNKVELRGVNTGAPLGRAKVYPQDELLRGNKDHQELSPVNKVQERRISQNGSHSVALRSSGEDDNPTGVVPRNEPERELFPQPAPQHNNAASEPHLAPINAHPSAPPMAPAAVSQAVSEPTAAKNSLAINTSATPVCNSPKISTYENVELETVQNQHLQKSGTGRGPAANDCP
jgi:hypothetical protein